MKISEKINPGKSISLLLFYVAMALSIVYFDLFQAIEDSSKNSPSVENVELVIQQNLSSSNSRYEFILDQNILINQPISCQKYVDFLIKRLFHDNRNLDHQFKEVTKKQLQVNYKSHQQIAFIISHQKMEEEAIKRTA